MLLVQETQDRLEIDRKKREKEMEKAHLEKLRLQVQKDKEERLAKMQKRTEGQDTALSHQQQQAPAATAAPVAAPAKKATEYTECVLQIRLPNGTALKENFKPTCAEFFFSGEFLISRFLTMRSYDVGIRLEMSLSALRRSRRMECIRSS
jgi:hypothetical protein